MIVSDDVKIKIVSILKLNPDYVETSYDKTSGKFWVKVPAGLTRNNLVMLEELFEIHMIIPTKIKNIDGLDIQIKPREEIEFDQ